MVHKGWQEGRSAAVAGALEDCHVNNPTWDWSSTWLNKADYLLSSVSPQARTKMSNTNKKGLCLTSALGSFSWSTCLEWLINGDQIQGLVLHGGFYTTTLSLFLVMKPGSLGTQSLTGFLQVRFIFAVAQRTSLTFWENNSVFFILYFFFLFYMFCW